MLYPNEKEKVELVLAIAREIGYGNLISHLKRAWALHLMEGNDKLTWESACRAGDVDAYPQEFTWPAADAIPTAIHRRDVELAHARKWLAASFLWCDFARERELLIRHQVIEQGLGILLIGAEGFHHQRLEIEFGWLATWVSEHFSYQVIQVDRHRRQIRFASGGTLRMILLETEAEKLYGLPHSWFYSYL